MNFTLTELVRLENMLLRLREHHNDGTTLVHLIDIVGAEINDGMDAEKDATDSETDR